MKKLLAILLAVCLLAGCTAAPDPTTAQTTVPTTAAPTTAATTMATAAIEPTYAESAISPLLYKVSDGDSTVWLFGSIHAGEEHFYPLPDYVLSAYHGADALAVECDVVAATANIMGMVDEIMPMVYMDGTTIRDHISPELYAKSVEALITAGMYMPMMDRFKPVLWYMLLESYLTLYTGADAELGIDMYFLNDAHETGKEIREIESIEFQYGMLASFSEPLQILLLEDIVASCSNPSVYGEEMEVLLQLWAEGDEAALTEHLTSDEMPTAPEEVKLVEEFNNAMVTSRNLGMADFAEEALQNNEEVFIVVGAAHVVGPGAMADLLAQRGYTVEVVRP